jgi:hypothetical protein
VLINEGLPQSGRLIKLNKIAIRQMSVSGRGKPEAVAMKVFYNIQTVL